MGNPTGFAADYRPAPPRTRSIRVARYIRELSGGKMFVTLGEAIYRGEHRREKRADNKCRTEGSSTKAGY